MKLYAIRDLKADAFAAPFMMQNDAVASRAVAAAAQEQDNHLGKNPGDYQLWFLGSYDEPTGNISSDPQLVCNVTSLVKE